MQWSWSFLGILNVSAQNGVVTVNILHWKQHCHHTQDLCAVYFWPVDAWALALQILFIYYTYIHIHRLLDSEFFLSMSFLMVGVEMWIIMVVTSELICAAVVGCVEQRGYVGVLHIVTLKWKD